MQVPIVTYTTQGYLHLTRNLYMSLCPLNRARFVALTWDQAAHMKLVDEGIPARLVQMPWQPVGTQTAAQHVWGTPQFKVTTFAKLPVLACYLADMAAQGDERPVLYVDGDVVALGNLDHLVQPYLAEHAWDLVCQCDESHTGLCMAPCCNLCSGVMLIRNTAQVRDMLCYHRHIGAQSLQTFDNNDQTYVNLLARQGLLRSATFPRDLCPNGVFVRDGCVPQQALLQHFNYLIGAEKVAAMQRCRMWFNAPLADASQAACPWA